MSKMGDSRQKPKDRAAGEVRAAGRGETTQAKATQAKGGLSLGLSVSFSARPVAPGVAAADKAQVQVNGAAGQGDAPAGRKTEQATPAEKTRRPLTPEEREQMKRELKAQLRAYVDALKKEMREKRETGEGVPDLEEAMTRAEMEAARVIAERKRQQLANQRVEDSVVKDDEVQDKVAEGTADARAVVAAVTASGSAAAQDHAQAGVAEGTGAGTRDVMNVATPAAEDGREGGTNEGQAAETAREDAGEAAGAGSEGHVSAIPKEELERLTRDIIAALKTVYDPEIPVDIYELGLVYRIDISDDRVITIDMTLTAPGCPVAGDMPGWVKKAVSEVEGVKDVKVNLVFDPPWDMSRMSDEARLALNMF